MDERKGPLARRRLRPWHWTLLALIVVALIGTVALSVGRDDSGTGADQACRTVVQALRASRDGKVTSEALLDVVRAQGPVAEAAGPNARAKSIALAIEDMRVNLEAGRPPPSVVVLYDLCG